MERALKAVDRLESAFDTPTVRSDVAARLAALHARTAPGTVLPGGYVLGDLIGAGGMGQVFLAKQCALGRTVAIKVAHSHLSEGPNVRERLVVEALAASRVRHCGSVEIFDFRQPDREEGPSFLVMEHIEGRRLTEMLRSDTVSVGRCVHLIVQLLWVLEEAHRSGVLHRDVKPDNVLVTVDRSGREHIKLVDYGLALVDDGWRVRGSTVPGVMYGTPGYMSPEQAGGSRVDARTDIYSTAVVLHALLTRTLPGQGRVSASGTVLATEAHAAVVTSAIPAPIASVLRRALAGCPDQRPPTAAAFARELAESMALLGAGST